ncbi:MAG: RHS repeat-associated core domain-containing protein [Desulfatibacillaceae bacterium]|nr:RHS repeat-associated core domain-containing protein [Desulfatibacillaceae bacterium]
MLWATRGLLDRHTGLVRFGFRDYDCQIGRWTAKDPIGFAAGDVDLFGYVGNDPVNAVDPWGLLSYEENRQRRKDINSGYTNKIIKTGVGLLVGKEIIKNFSKAGLGVTAGELIMYCFRRNWTFPLFGLV